MDSIAEIHTKDAEIVMYGNLIEDRDHIRTHYHDFLDKLAYVRYVVTSPVWETEHTAHFYRETYMMSLKGCLAIVHSLEKIEFTADGKVKKHRSEWEETDKEIAEDLACHHEDGHHSVDHLTDEKKKYINFVYKVHQDIEKGEIDRFMTNIHQYSSLHIHGGVEYFNPKGIREWFGKLFDKTRHILFTPSGHVLVRNQLSSFVSTLFFVTKTGCAHTFNVVSYLHHDTEGHLQRLEFYFAGKTAQEFDLMLEGDCRLNSRLHGIHDEL